MDLKDAVAEVTTTEKTLLTMPRWRLAIYGVVIVFALSYLIWCKVHKPAPAPGIPVVAPPAVDVAKVTGPVLAVPLKVVPKRAVAKAIPEVADEVADPEEEVVDTADIPYTDNGVKTVTFMNITTGVAKTVYVPKPSPWFAFEGGNAVGIRYRLSTHGTREEAYYRRDFVQVKNLHISGEVGGERDSVRGAGAFVGAQAEVRW